MSILEAVIGMVPMVIISDILWKRGNNYRELYTDLLIDYLNLKNERRLWHEAIHNNRESADSRSSADGFHQNVKSSSSRTGYSALGERS